MFLKKFKQIFAQTYTKVWKNILLSQEYINNPLTNAHDIDGQAFIPSLMIRPNHLDSRLLPITKLSINYFACGSQNPPILDVYIFQQRACDYKSPIGLYYSPIPSIRYKGPKNSPCTFMKTLSPYSSLTASRTYLGHSTIVS